MEIEKKGTYIVPISNQYQPLLGYDHVCNHDTRRKMFHFCQKYAGLQKLFKFCKKAGSAFSILCFGVLD